VLVFCAPHQFIHRIVKQLPGLVRKDAIAISLIKVGELGGAGVLGC
jgi:glycerol-3-phosphate dehydrogenase